MPSSSYHSHSLNKQDIARFSRQLILKGIGPSGQERIRKIKVLVVGAGGLGCPVSLYLVAAGIGKIGVIDHDIVSIENLHRQIAHKEASVGESKVKSLENALLSLNSRVEITTYEELLTSKNALQIFQQYDIVADCSDNVATRYLTNDACVLTGKPLVSGSALGWEGQLTVYNNGPKCPCYRCIFPEPPRPDTVTSCSESGVVGPVVGVIGSMQALEVLKIAAFGKSSFAGTLWMFDGFDGKTRTISLREKMPACAICSVKPSIRELQDYEKFCGSGSNDKIRTLELLSPEDRISPQEYAKLRHKSILIDVRPRTEFEICHLPEARNFDWEDMKKWKAEFIIDKFNAERARLETNGDITNVFLICHRGNDSQLVTKMLQERLGMLENRFRIRDIVGGLEAWSCEVEEDFPRY